jgi:2-(1,2-epoxy-1,2-dihydrophenyl)acetyl-CoA isomerase
MQHSGLILEEQKGKVLYIKLNRPEKLNTFIEPMRSEINLLLESLHSRDDVYVCIITGNGRGFCAGGDIKIMERIIADSDFDRIQEFLNWGRSIVLGIRELPIPVIAAVNGPAAGAGMNLALACDIRLASDRATFGQTFIKIGLHPDWGGTYLLPKLTNTARALEMFWTGQMIKATEAEKMGLVNRVIPHDDFEQEVELLANQIASHSKVVLEYSKKGVYQGIEESLESILKHEEDAQAKCIRSGEAKRGMDRFLKQRTSRKVKNVPIKQG